MRCDLFWLGAVGGLERGAARVPVTALGRGKIHVDGGTHNRMYELDDRLSAQNSGARERAHRLDSPVPFEAGQPARLTEFGAGSEHGCGSRPRETTVPTHGEQGQYTPGPHARA